MIVKNTIFDFLLKYKRYIFNREIMQHKRQVNSGKFYAEMAFLCLIFVFDPYSGQNILPDQGF